MFLYAITDSRRLATEFSARASVLSRQAEQWAMSGVDAIQIREKDLDTGQVEKLVLQVRKVVEGSQTQVYVNGRVDVAIATGAELHLPAGGLRPSEVLSVFAAAGVTGSHISISCHSVADVEQAAAAGATMALLAPIFGKQISSVRSELPGLGLDVLRQACGFRSAGITPFPVVALGGVSAENAQQCLEAGATGVAGIRLFLEDEYLLIPA